MWVIFHPILLQILCQQQQSRTRKNVVTLYVAKLYRYLQTNLYQILCADNGRTIGKKFLRRNENFHY